jgi:hypothetical protein
MISSYKILQVYLVHFMNLVSVSCEIEPYAVIGTTGQYGRQIVGIENNSD